MYSLKHGILKVSMKLFSIDKVDNSIKINFFGIKISYTRKLYKKINKVIKNYKYVHIMYNDKFNKPFVDFLNRNFHSEEHLVLCQKVFEDKEPTPFPVGDNVYEFDRIDRINLHAGNIDKLIFHGLFQDQVINKLSDEPNLLKKSYWLIWGGDLYNAQRDEKNDYVRKNFKKFGVGIVSDMDFYRRQYNDDKEFIKISYIFPLKKEMLDKCIRKPGDTIKIQINNSADDSTLEILDKLAIFKDKNIQVRTILSYGKLEFRDQIIRKGNELFGEKFEYLDTLLSPEEYSSYIAQNDIFILNQNRQQGVGNALANVYLGNKVFIRSDISTSRHFNDERIRIFDTAMIGDMDFADFINFPETVKGNNKKEIEKYYDEEYLKFLWDKLFND